MSPKTKGTNNDSTKENNDHPLSFVLQGPQTYRCFNFEANKNVEDQCEDAKFYCLQHDMFLCRHCFDDHLKHQGAESITNHLAKDFNMWN